MKKLILSLCLLGSLQLQARDLVGAELEIYKSAVLEQFIKENFPQTCVTGLDYQRLIERSEYGYISRGDQPLLSFTTYEDNRRYAKQIVITTAKDYLEIEKVEYKYYKLGKVNRGDLQNPIIVDGYIFLYSHSCGK